MNERLSTSQHHMIRQQYFADDGAVARGRDFLDTMFPLADGSHHDVVSYEIYYQHLCAFLNSGECVGLRHPDRLAGFSGHRENPASILLRDNEVQVEIEIDPASITGRADKAGVSRIRADIWFETARSPAKDCKDSMAVPEIERDAH